MQTIVSCISFVSFVTPFPFIQILNLSRFILITVGDPVVLFYASDAPWRGNIVKNNMGGQVTDGCWLHRMKNGSLIMLWSNFSAGGYTIGTARSASGEIFGPWIQDPEPLWAMDGGHAMLFYTFEGQLMMSFHCNNKEKKMHLCQMEEQGDRLRIINEITGNWYNSVSGEYAARYGYREACTDEAVMTPYRFSRGR